VAELYEIQEKKLTIRDKMEIERGGATAATVKKALSDRLGRTRPGPSLPTGQRRLPSSLGVTMAMELGSERPRTARHERASTPSVRSSIDVRLRRRVEELGVLVLGRVSVGVEDELVGAVVRDLQRSAGVDVNQRSCGNVLTFRRVADVHRERSCEDDEGFFLQSMPVTTARGSRLVAPDIPARVCESGNVAQLRDVASRLARLVRSSDPLELVWPDDAKSHSSTLRRSGLVCAGVRTTDCARVPE
jgi:hypothetical protein